MLFILKCMDLYSALPGLKLGATGTLPSPPFRKYTKLFVTKCPFSFFLLSSYSVGCLWHSHGKNPVRLYPKLQSQPIGLPKIFIDYLFFQADQSDCTKSVSIFNRFASSEER